MLEFNFHPFPILTTERLLLRTITLDDRNEVFTIRSDERVMKYVDRPLATTLAEADELITRMIDGVQKNDSITWAISLKNDPKLIGTIGFWRTDKENYRAEVGYSLLYDMHGKGFMQEALTKVLEYGFKVMQLHTVAADVNPANAPSIKLLERTGFIREAYFRENYYFNGKFLDSAIYGLLNPY